MEISNKINSIPSDINIHKTISKIMGNRKNSVDKGFDIDGLQQKR
jgi:2-oxoglutarate dehydrogenase complex dehydrogenase (E1) component-like enzyme